MASPPPPPQPPPAPGPIVPAGLTFLAAPPPPAPAYFMQPEQFQAAKYFTFIFFGLSVFVILLFGGFVICHCYRRLRYDSQRSREHEIQVAQLAAAAAAGGSRPNRDVVIMVPIKEGYVVTNPDGGTDIAYIPDPPSTPRRSKLRPSTLSASVAASPSDATPSQSASPRLTAAASAPASPSRGAADADGSDARTSLEVMRPGSDVRWLHSVSSMPSSPAASSAAGGAEARSQSSADRLDQYWRQRQAQVYQIF